MCGPHSDVAGEEARHHRHAIVRRTVTVQTPFETVDVEVRKPRRLCVIPVR